MAAYILYMCMRVCACSVGDKGLSDRRIRCWVGQEGFVLVCVCRWMRF